MTEPATIAPPGKPGAGGGIPPSRRDLWVLRAVAAVLTAVVLTPLARGGYVLSYDMVFVPRQALRWDLIAPASGLPRAVPEDAVVSLLSFAAPGWLLQRVVLVGIVYAAAMGAGRLVPAHRLSTRIVAAIGYGWTPFLAERLLIGQWGLLLAYAALPWLIAAAMRARAGLPGAVSRVILTSALCAITPTGGLIALATTMAMVVRWRLVLRRVRRRAWRWRVRSVVRNPRAVAAGAVAVLNLPWLVAALLSDAGGGSDPVGVAAFAARGENWSGPLGALAGTGGIWNAQTTPVSRASVLAPLVTAVVVALAAYGLPVLIRRWPAGAAKRLAVLAAGGFVVALLGTVPGVATLLGWTVSRVPGAGLLRDGQKFVAVYAVLLVVGMALGVERISAKLAPDRALVVLVAAMVVPVALMPDLAFGAAGALRPVRYPGDWDRVAAIVGDSPGEVLCLPFSEYHRYGWNADRVVIDPAARYLPVDVLSDDTLRVGPMVVAGESPRAARVQALLAAGTPVAAVGVRWVLVEHDTGGIVPAGALEGLRPVFMGTALDLYENPYPAPRPAPSVARRILLGAVTLVVLLTLGLAIWRLRGSPTPW
jgi:hypothetical protein